MPVIPFSQTVPVHPNAQLQENDPGLLTQLPPLQHGDETAHSSISIDVLQMSQLYIKFVNVKVLLGDKQWKQKIKIP